MNFLDVRTVIFSHVATDALCVALLFFLWRQNRKRFDGLAFWALDFLCQAVATLLIILRGHIPDWASIVVSNTLVIGGGILGYIGLQRFFGKRGRQIHNYFFLVLFACIHYYFTDIQPAIHLRKINTAFGLVFICSQCAWFLLRSLSPDMRPVARSVGLVFVAFCLANVGQIITSIVNPYPTEDFFRTDVYNTIILMVYQLLLILLAYSLNLMVNQRLLLEVRTQEEKFFKAFHSSPYALLLTQASTGGIIEVNEAFSQISGHTSTEAIGRTTLELNLWAHEADRALMLQELSRNNRVYQEEFQFRKKSGELLTGLFSAEPLVIGGEKCLVASINDITERKRAEQEREQLLAQLIQKNAQVLAYAQIKAELLDEVNHRVKNNLAGIRSILQLERHKFAPGAVEYVLLTDLQTRIDGMLMVHSLLSESQWSPLNLGDLCRKIVLNGLMTSPVREHLVFEPTFRPDTCYHQKIIPSQATTLALILGELTMNAVKYAFKERSSGHLWLTATLETEGQQLEMAFRDDGPGWPADVLAGQRKGLGLRLVHNVVQAVPDGRLQLVNDGGAVAIFTFKLARS